MGAESGALEKLEDEKPRSSPMSMKEAQFLSWKQRKDAAASAKRAEAARKRDADIAAGTIQRNGRELFRHEPWVFDNTLY